MRKLALVILLSAGVLEAAPRRRAVTPAQFPQCLAVAGTPAVTFSRDGGVTVAPREMALHGIGYTYGVAVLDGGQTLLSAHNDLVSLSRDAGCTWEAVGRVTGPDLFPPSITAAPDGRAYIWSDNREILARYASGSLTALKPPAEVMGLGADSTRVRIAGGDGVLWTSLDGGDSWQRSGSGIPGGSTIVYRGAFDPSNLDHALMGTASTGAFLTFDGGHTWQPAAGMANGFNVFSIVISPADPNVVWAMAIRLADSSRHIYLSRDGGRTFETAIDGGNGVTLTNGVVMAAHPVDPNVFYFVFGTFFQGYGTDLLRFDAASRALTVMHHSFHDIDAIAFSPLDPDVMYFGLEVVEPASP